MRTMTIEFSNTGFFKAIVTHSHRDGPSTYTMTGLTTGASTTLIGVVGISTGEFQFPLLGKNDEIEVDLESESFLPVRVLSAEWEADFTIRSARGQVR